MRSEGHLRASSGRLTYFAEQLRVQDAQLLANTARLREQEAQL